MRLKFLIRFGSAKSIRCSVRFGLTEVMDASTLWHVSKICPDIVYTCRWAIVMTIGRKRRSTIGIMYAMWRWPMGSFGVIWKESFFSVRKAAEVNRNFGESHTLTVVLLYVWGRSRRWPTERQVWRSCERCNRVNKVLTRNAYVRVTQARYFYSSEMFVL